MLPHYYSQHNLFDKIKYKLFSIFIAYYIVFLSHHTTPTAENPMPNPTESVMVMFLMSLNNFGTTYEAFSRTEHETVAKVLIFKDFI